MRIATYNVEWFTELFDKNDELLRNGEWSSRHNVTRAEQADALGVVFRAMNADAVLVVEAPDASNTRNTITALENFSSAYGLRTSEAIMGFSNDTKQEIALLYDPAALSVHHAPRAGTPETPRFDGVFSIDLDVDAKLDKVTFSKPPLELDVKTASGFAFKMIGAHLKSKAPHAAKTKDQIKAVGIANRRKQLAQAIWLRARVDQLLNEGHSVVVLGDLNDGPGLDGFEDLFGRSSVEIILGDADQPKLYDPHAARALSHRFGAVPTTARFWIRQEKRYLQALLDYIMVSSDLMTKEPIWRIWHPLDDPECWADNTLREALVLASDHFPVTMDIDL